MSPSRVLFSALALTLAGSAGCDGTLKYIGFDIRYGGHPVHVSKFYNDGFGTAGPEHQAFDFVQAGNTTGAVRLMEGACAERPNDVWRHYDLGILYEASGDWSRAEAEMNTALKLRSGDTKLYSDELAFIAAHRNGG